MKSLFSSVVLGALALSGVFFSADAQACGGCFHIQQSESGQVTGHRMIFSVSNDKTTLWDQISYDGNPESFAWVLPIHGQVDIGLSSDALFEQLDSLTRLTIVSPDINCGPTTCPDSNGAGGAGATSTFSQTTTSSSVTVIAEETVGPFETVQLSSADPAALQMWLADHGYVIPADVVPIIDAYVNEGFDFLAMRLAPGENVNSMQPVRVTSPGAGLGLPLRMVAAGTGAVTPITLWVVGEGRYEPANFPSFEITEDQLVWDWDAQKSNYTTLKMDGFAATQGAGWLVEAASPQYPGNIGDPLLDTAAYDPASSGYGDTSEEALTAAAEDMDALYGTVDPGSLWVTRLHAQLSKAALATDLEIGASANQETLYPYYYVQNTTGTPPECPPPPDCGEGGNGSGANGAGASGAGTNGVGLWTPAGDGGAGANSEDGGSSAGGSGGCSVGGPAPAAGALLAALGLAAALRRRRRSRSSRA